MYRLLTVLIITLTCPALLAGICLAGSGLVRNQDGTNGRLSPLGDDIGTYADPHGNHTIVTKPGTETPVGLGPHGDIESGNRSSFGTPMPPNHLTPAPVLPFNPNRALSPTPLPNPQPAPDGTGRVGR